MHGKNYKMSTNHMLTKWTETWLTSKYSPLNLAHITLTDITDCCCRWLVRLQMCRLSCNGANRYCWQSTHIRSIIIIMYFIFICGSYVLSQQLNTWENEFLIRYNSDFDSVVDLHCTKESPTNLHSSSFTYVCRFLFSVYSNFSKDLMHLSTFFFFWKVDLKSGFDFHSTHLQRNER